jgi:hypothetical protein
MRAGQAAIITEGEYDDYHIVNVVMCIRAFDESIEYTEFRGTEGYRAVNTAWPWNRATNWEENFVAFLKQKGLVSDLDWETIDL